MKQKILLLRVAHEYDMLVLAVPLTQETLQFLHTCKTFAKETSSQSKDLGLDLYTMNFGFYEFDVYEDAVSLSDVLDEKGDGFTAIVEGLPSDAGDSVRIDYGVCVTTGDSMSFEFGIKHVPNTYSTHSFNADQTFKDAWREALKAAS